MPKKRIETTTSRTAEWTCLARAASSLETNSHYRSIDFDKESLPARLDESGFRKDHKSLFVLEGLLMYLQAESVAATFQTIQEYAARHSRVVLDYVCASVLRNENLYYGEPRVTALVSRAGEQWHFGIEKGKVEQFLSAYGLSLIDHMDAAELERAYFSDSAGRIVGRVSGVHCLVTAEQQ